MLTGLVGCKPIFMSKSGTWKEEFASASSDLHGNGLESLKI